MNALETARKLLGQLFIVGFDGLELSDETASFLSQANIGGVILFSPNYESPGQVAELINQVQQCRTELPLWVSVDHEGGKVQRFKKPFTKIPEAATIGKHDSAKLVFELATMIGAELRAVGINVNYCPIADIHTNPKNPIIGNRAYGTDEETVSRNVSAMVRGHLVSQVQPCVKHFPGHGDTTVDSHLALPTINTPIELLHEREFKPFVKGFKSRCQMVMTAHVVHSTIDPKLPATLSKKFLQDILRGELRYRGLIISDDLEMQAITDHFGPEDAPRMAVEAGCDLLIYRSEKAARHGYAALDKALVDGTLSPARVIEAAELVQTIKREVLLPYEPVAIAELGQKIGTPENEALAQKLS